MHDFGNILLGYFDCDTLLRGREKLSQSLLSGIRTHLLSDATILSRSYGRIFIDYASNWAGFPLVYLKITGSEVVDYLGTGSYEHCELAVAVINDADNGGSDATVGLIEKSVRDFLLSSRAFTATGYLSPAIIACQSRSDLRLLKVDDFAYWQSESTWLVGGHYSG